MNPVDPEIENQIKALVWNPVPELVLASALQAALKPRPNDTKIAKLRDLLKSIPAPVRWSLAACWILALGFRLATPASPVGPHEKFANAAKAFQSIQQTNDQIHELERQLHHHGIAKR